MLSKSTANGQWPESPWYSPFGVPPSSLPRSLGLLKFYVVPLGSLFIQLTWGLVLLFVMPPLNRGHVQLIYFVFISTNFWSSRDYRTWFKRLPNFNIRFWKAGSFFTFPPSPTPIRTTSPQEPLTVSEFFPLKFSVWAFQPPPWLTWVFFFWSRWALWHLQATNTSAPSWGCPLASVYVLNWIWLVFLPSPLNQPSYLFRSRFPLSHNSGTPHNWLLITDLFSWPTNDFFTAMTSRFLIFFIKGAVGENAPPSIPRWYAFDLIPPPDGGPFFPVGSALILFPKRPL